MFDTIIIILFGELCYVLGMITGIRCFKEEIIIDEIPNSVLDETVKFENEMNETRNRIISMLLNKLKSSITDEEYNLILEECDRLSEHKSIVDSPILFWKRFKEHQNK